jgi:hypothetical protein
MNEQRGGDGDESERPRRHEQRGPRARARLRRDHDVTQAEAFRAVHERDGR